MDENSGRVHGAAERGRNRTRKTLTDRGFDPRECLVDGRFRGLSAKIREKPAGLGDYLMPAELARKSLELRLREKLFDAGKPPKRRGWLSF
jgi:hypothetical protein